MTNTTYTVDHAKYEEWKEEKKAGETDSYLAYI